LHLRPGVSLSRRVLLRRAILAVPGLLAFPRLAWSEPARTVRQHGARGDGKTSDTAAIQKAIDAAGAGGVVLFPRGDYRSGTLHLRDGVTLKLDAGATLLASRDDEDFDHYSPPDYDSFADRETTDFTFALLQGHGVEQVSIVGPGRIDGNRRARGGPKPIALKECRHVLIRGVTIVNAPSYNISLLGCDDVDIRGVTIKNGYADGIDPDGCRRVRISGCRVESRDDAICLKSSLALGARRSTEYVVVTGCELVNVRNGLKIGTESCGDFRNIVFRNCRMWGRPEPFNPPSVLDLRPFPSAGISIQNVDGGRLEQVVVSNITMTNIRAPIFVRLGERGAGQPKPVPGELTKVTISDVVATGADWTSSIMGVPSRDVTDVALSNIRVSGKGGGSEALLDKPVPEKEREYPDAARFRNLPAYGLYCRHVTGLRVDRTTITVDKPDPRPALVLDDVNEASVRGMSVTAPAKGTAVVWLRSAKDCVLSGIRATGAAVLARLSEAETARVRVVASARQVVLVDRGVEAAALRTEGPVTRRESPAAEPRGVAGE